MIPSGQVIGTPQVQPAIGGSANVFRPANAPRQGGIPEIDLRGISVLASLQQEKQERKLVEEYLPQATAAFEAGGTELTDAISRPDDSDAALTRVIKELNLPASTHPRVRRHLQELAASRYLTTEFLGAIDRDLETGAMFYGEDGRVLENFDPEAWFTAKWKEHKDAPIFKVPGGFRAIQSVMPTLGSQKIGEAGAAWGKALDAQGQQDVAATLEPTITSFADGEPGPELLGLLTQRITDSHSLGIPGVRKSVMMAIEAAVLKEGQVDPQGAVDIMVRSLDNVQIGPEKLGDNLEALQRFTPMIEKYERRAEQQVQEEAIKAEAHLQKVRNVFYTLKHSDPSSAASWTEEFISANVPPIARGLAYAELELLQRSERNGRLADATAASTELFNDLRKSAINGDLPYEQYAPNKANLTEDQVRQMEGIYEDMNTARGVILNPIIRGMQGDIDRIVAQLPPSELTRVSGIPEGIREGTNTAIMALSKSLDSDGITPGNPEYTKRIVEFTQERVKIVEGVRKELEARYTKESDALITDLLAATVGLDPAKAQQLFDQGVETGLLTPENQSKLLPQVQTAYTRARDYLSPQGREIQTRANGFMQLASAMQAPGLAEENAFSFGATVNQKLKAMSGEEGIGVEQGLITVAEEFFKNQAPNLPEAAREAGVRAALDAHITKLELELFGIDYEAVQERVTNGKSPSFSAALVDRKRRVALSAHQADIRKRAEGMPAPALDVLQRLDYVTSADGKISLPPHYQTTGMQMATDLWTKERSRSSVRDALTKGPSVIKDRSGLNAPIEPPVQEALWIHSAGWAGMLSAEDLFNDQVFINDGWDFNRADYQKELDEREAARAANPELITVSGVTVTTFPYRVARRIEHLKEKLTTKPLGGARQLLNLYDMPLVFSLKRGEPNEEDLDAWVAKVGEEELQLWLMEITGDDEANTADWVKAQRTAIRKYNELR